LRIEEALSRHTQSSILNPQFSILNPPFMPRNPPFVAWPWKARASPRIVMSIMKSLRFALLLFLLSLSASLFAQSDSPKAFERLKALAGNWQGAIHTTPPTPAIDGAAMNVSLRVTSMGNTLMHEMTGAGRPDDPITMFYLAEDNLELVHYCDAGNRPRMTGKPSADGKQVVFEFAHVDGSTKYGHMHHVVFTFIDENHHAEEWTFMTPGGKPVVANVELTRVAK